MVDSALPARLYRAIRVAGHAIVGVSIGNTDRSTWRVQPDALQADAQPVINAFNPNDTAHALTDADERADLYYKDKDVLAMVAVILEKTDSAFNTTDTNAQQRTKVVAAAVRFNQRRKWVERNYAFMNF